MRVVGVALLVLVASCYQGPAAGLSCKIRCTEGCPSGMACTQGFCAASGVTCGGAADSGVDSAPSCGATGMACCSGEPACVTNTHCVSGTCQECVTSVGLGRHHVCVVKRDGTVWCAGNNESGELGNGTVTSSATAVQAVDANGPITNASAVGGGGYHTCAVRAGGEVWCWGYGGYAALGYNSYTSSPVAVRVVTSSLVPLTGIAELIAGWSHTCALDTAGVLWCWGYNSDGQLGDNTATWRPTAVRVLTASAQPFSGVTKFSIGKNHSCLLDASSNLWCWGANGGRIGDGTTTTRYLPVMVLAAPRSFAAGRRHTCAVTSDGSTACWGDNRQGWVGTGGDALVPTPVLIGDGGTAFQGAASVAAGGSSCTVTVDQHVYCWGANTHGQAGTGAGGLYPLQVTHRDGTPLTNVDRLMAANSRVCAHRTTGEILCWGRNLNGELANGTLVNQAFPTPLGFSCP